MENHKLAKLLLHQVFVKNDNSQVLAKKELYTTL